MRFRVTDERNFSHAFDAATPDELTEGIRDAWERFMEKHWDMERMGHPRLAYHIRMSQIDRWFEERLERDDVTDELEAQWRQNVRYERTRTKKLLGRVRRLSPLFIHVQSEEGRWLTLSEAGGGSASGRTRVVYNETKSPEILKWARGALEHHRSIGALINDVVGDVKRPRLEIVED